MEKVFHVRANCIILAYFYDIDRGNGMAVFFGRALVERMNWDGYMKPVGDNDGTELTTEGLISGLTSLMNDFKSREENPLEMLKKSDMYVSNKE